MLGLSSEGIVSSTGEVTWHFVVQEFQMPSIYTFTFLWVSGTIFQLWVVYTPTSITEDLELFSGFKIRVLWLFCLIIPLGLSKTLRFEIIECWIVYTWKANFWLSKFIYREVRLFTLSADRILRNCIAIVFTNITVIFQNTLPSQAYGTFPYFLCIKWWPVNAQIMRMIFQIFTYMVVTFCRCLYVWVLRDGGIGPLTLSSP